MFVRKSRVGQVTRNRDFFPQKNQQWFYNKILSFRLWLYSDLFLQMCQTKHILRRLVPLNFFSNATRISTSTKDHFTLAWKQLLTRVMKNAGQRNDYELYDTINSSCFKDAAVQTLNRVSIFSVTMSVLKWIVLQNASSLQLQLQVQFNFFSSGTCNFIMNK